MSSPLHHTRIGNIAYALGMTACLTPVVAGGCDALNVEGLVIPLIAMAAASVAVGAAQRLGTTASSRVVAVMGMLGGGFMVACAFVVRSLFSGTLLSAGGLVTDILLICLAIPIGLLQSVPELAVMRARQSGAKSHDDTDRLITAAGLWTMMWPVIITFILNVTQSNRETLFFMSVETVEMVLLNIGAAIAAFGFGRSFLRRQWVERAKRGEIEGIRVRVLAETEAPPQVLPMTRIGVGEELAVIEVVTRPAQSAYRNAEYVHPIALT